MSFGKKIKILIDFMKIIFKHEKKLVFILLALSIVNSIIPWVTLINTQILINSLQSNMSVLSGNLFLSLLLFPSILIISEIVSAMNSFYSQYYSEVLNYDFSVDILNKVNKLDFEQFEDSKFYDLLQRAEQSSGKTAYGISMIIFSIIGQVIATSIYCFILIKWHWWSIGLIIVLSFINSYQISKISQKEYEILFNRTKNERKSWYFAHLLNKDLNVKETRVFSLEKLFLDCFVKYRKKFINQNTKINFEKQKIILLGQVIATCLFACFLYLLVKETNSGSILLGTFMMYINTINNVRNSVKNIISSLFQLNTHSLYAEDVLVFFEYKNKEQIIEEKRKIIIDKIYNIDLVNVSYKYKNATKYSLQNISFKFEMNNNYILVGENGSGKSTLTKIILGLYPSYEGAIFINGIDLKKIDITSYQKCLTTVFQDHTKFQFSFSTAIKLSDYSNPNSIFESVVDKTDLKKTLERLPNKEEQILGTWFEDGVQISGGEWQKIAIARAFYRESASVAIFDESNASLDPLTEIKIYNEYSKFVEGKIGIFVTHRLKNLKFYGEIIVMKKGGIIENGDFSSLMKEAGYFYDMYEALNTTGIDETS